MLRVVVPIRFASRALSTARTASRQGARARSLTGQLRPRSTRAATRSALRARPRNDLLLRRVQPARDGRRAVGEEYEVVPVQLARRRPRGRVSVSESRADGVLERRAVGEELVGGAQAQQLEKQLGARPARRRVLVGADGLGEQRERAERVRALNEVGRGVARGGVDDLDGDEGVVEQRDQPHVDDGGGQRAAHLGSGRTDEGARRDDDLGAQVRHLHRDRLGELGQRWRARRELQRVALELQPQRNERVRAALPQVGVHVVQDCQQLGHRRPRQLLARR
mmetsp:Transcript_36396/g.90795  ORF Transcript_36396/g.90795 Transcript_36396/m.90795 type:complete len:280 (-) Transcript_36396:79-918(-)